MFDDNPDTSWHSAKNREKDEEDYGVRQAAAEILSVLEPVTLVEFADGLEHANGSAVLRILELARAGKDLDESESESESESE